MKNMLPNISKNDLEKGVAIEEIAKIMADEKNIKVVVEKSFVQDSEPLETVIRIITDEKKYFDENILTLESDSATFYYSSSRNEAKINFYVDDLNGVINEIIAFSIYGIDIIFYENFLRQVESDKNFFTVIQWN